MSSPELELLGEGFHARLQSFGTSACLGHLARRLRELLVGHGESDMVGNTAGDRDIFDAEGVRLLRPELQAHDLVACGRIHCQKRTIAGRQHALLEIDGLSAPLLLEAEIRPLPTGVGKAPPPSVKLTFCPMVSNIARITRTRSGWD